MGGEQGWLIFGVQSKRKVEEAAAEVWRGEGGGGGRFQFNRAVV